MSNDIKNIVIFSMHRSGSTYMNTRIAYGLGMHYGLQDKRDMKVRNLGEVSGWGPFITSKNRMDGLAGDVKNIKEHGGDYTSDMFVWEMNDGILRRRKKTNSVLAEIESRESLLRSAAWTNHAVMRIQPWTWTEMLDRLVDAALVPDAHYVVLWRRDMLAWLTSLFILNRTMRHQGEIVFDGFRFNTRAKIEKLIDVRSQYIENFLRTISKLSDRKDRVTIIETTNIDKHDVLEWNDGVSMALPAKESVPKAGQIYYIDKNGNPVSKEKMIHPRAMYKLEKVADAVTQRHDWNNAVYNAIYK